MLKKYDHFTRKGLLTTTAVLGLAAAMMTSGIPARVQSAYADAVRVEAPSVPGFAGVVEAVTPAVVSVRVKSNITPVSSDGFSLGIPGLDNLPKDHPMRRLFKDFGFGKGMGKPDQFSERDDRGAEPLQPRRARPVSQGSGFFITADGYLVTNNHVVDDGTEFSVILHDGTELDATLVGKDARTDLAVLKVDGDEDFTYVEFASDDKTRIGDWVVAVGNPFGLGGTVTAGIISARGRDIGAGPYDDFIQTDASINPGNSGGPLINMEGKVVGINTAIIAGGQGIGFAIPVNMAKGIIEQLQTKGEVTRGWLGIGIQDLTKELKDYYGIKGDAGVLVTKAFPGDPAEKAGIRAKDIILEVNGKKIDSSRELSRTIAESPVGQKTQLLVLRDGAEKKFAIELGKRPETMTTAESPEIQKKNPLGIAVSNLTPEIIQQFQLQDETGVMVVGVEPDSKGEEAGVLPGDLIKEINHRGVENVDQYLKELGKFKEGETISLYILRSNKGYMAITLTK